MQIFEEKIKKELLIQKSFLDFVKFYNYNLELLFEKANVSDEVKKYCKKNNIVYPYLDTFFPALKSVSEIENSLKEEKNQETLKQMQTQKQNLYAIGDIINNINMNNHKNHNLEELSNYVINYLSSDTPKTKEIINTEIKEILKAKSLDKQLDFNKSFNNDFNYQHLEIIYYGSLVYLNSLSTKELDKLHKDHNISTKEQENIVKQMALKHSLYDTNKAKQIGKFFINSLDNNLPDKSFLKLLAKTNLSEFFKNPAKFKNKDKSYKKDYEKTLELMFNNLQKSRIKDDVLTYVNDNSAYNFENSAPKVVKKATKTSQEDFENEFRATFDSESETIPELYKDINSQLSQYLYQNYDRNDILVAMSSQDGLSDDDKKRLVSLTLSKNWSESDNKEYLEKILPSFVANVLINDDAKATAINIENIFKYNPSRYDENVNIKYQQGNIVLKRNKQLVKDVSFYHNNYDRVNAEINYKNDLVKVLNAQNIVKNNLINKVNKLDTKVIAIKNANIQKFKEYNDELSQTAYKLNNNKWGVLTNLSKSRAIMIPLLLFNAPLSVGILGFSYLLPLIRKKIIQKRYQNVYDNLQQQKNLSQKEADIINENKKTLVLDKTKAIADFGVANNLIDLNEYQKAQSLLAKTTANHTQGQSIFTKIPEDDYQETKDYKQRLYQQSLRNNKEMDKEISALVKNPSVSVSEYYHHLIKTDDRENIILPKHIFKSELDAKVFYDNYYSTRKIDKSLFNKEAFNKEYANTFQFSTLSGKVDDDFELLFNQFSSKLLDKNYPKEPLNHLRQYRKEFLLLDHRKMDVVSFLTIHKDLFEKLDIESSNLDNNFRESLSFVKSFIDKSNDNLFNLKITNDEEKFIHSAYNEVFDNYCMSYNQDYQHIVDTLISPKSPLKIAIAKQMKDINNSIYEIDKKELDKQAQFNALQKTPQKTNKKINQKQNNNEITMQ